MSDESENIWSDVNIRHCIFCSVPSKHADKFVLQEFFSACGPVKRVHRVKIGNPDPPVFLIEMLEEYGKQQALLLNGCTFVDSVITVVAVVSPLLTSVLTGSTAASATASVQAPASSSSAVGTVAPTSSSEPPVDAALRTIHVGNVPSTVSEQDLVSHFAECGPVFYVKLAGEVTKPTRFAFVEFQGLDGVQRALSQPQTTPLHGRIVTVKQSHTAIIKPAHILKQELGSSGSPTDLLGNLPGATPGAAVNLFDVARTVHISGIVSAITQEHLAEFFSSCGTVTFVKLAGDGNQPSRFGFIEFADPASAFLALRFNGTMLVDRVMQVKQATCAVIKPASALAAAANLAATTGASAGAFGPNKSMRAMADQLRAAQTSRMPEMSATIINPMMQGGPAGGVGAGLMPPPLTSLASPADMAVWASVDVKNCVYSAVPSRHAVDHVVKEFFSACGDVCHVHRLALIQPESPPLFLVEMANEAGKAQALLLNGCLFVDCAITVSPVVSPLVTSMLTASAAGFGAAFSATNSPDAPQRTVHVGNVPSECNEQDIANHFADCGLVTYVKLAGDGTKPTRFIFVEFATIDGAQRAIATKSGPSLNGRPLSVKQSHTAIIKPQHFLLKQDLTSVSRRKDDYSVASPTSSINLFDVARTIHVANISSLTTQEQLSEFFRSCGPVTYTKLAGDSNQPQRFGFVEFADPTSVHLSWLPNTVD